MDKTKEPDPGGSEQQNLGFKKLKNRKTDHTVGLNFCISKYKSSIQPYGQFFCFSDLVVLKRCLLVRQGDPAIKGRNKLKQD